MNLNIAKDKNKTENLSLIDTHCHIHESDFPLDQRETLLASAAANVQTIFCVGTNMQSSRETIDFAKNFDDKFGVKIFSIIGVHPHESKDFSEDNLKEMQKMIQENREQIKGIGEIGLDYFYEFSSREKQKNALKMQIQLACENNLPISFHVRDDRKNSGEVWRDFWKILDDFNDNFRGVLHSYTEQNHDNLRKAISRGFYFGVNGISTFAKENEKNLWRKIPLNKILLETDAPFLAPIPFRGKTNQPSFVPKIVESLADLRNEKYEEIAKNANKNSAELFKI